MKECPECKRLIKPEDWSKYRNMCIYCSVGNQIADTVERAAKRGNHSFVDKIIDGFAKEKNETEKE